MRILTADQFVSSVISMLALQNQKHFELQDSEFDQMFQSAYTELLEQETNLNVSVNFSFYTDALHGDSADLREALYAAREKKLISINNPTFHTFDIKLNDERAQRYLDKTPLKQEFLHDIVMKYFVPKTVWA